jgi:glycosyltransferase involved in cell wall biosynthesis
VDVLAVTPYYQPEGGGLERYAHETLARLAARGHDVGTLTFTSDGQPDEEREGVRVQRHEPSLRLGNAPISAAFPGEVRAAIHQREPDVVVAHTPVPFPAESAFLAAWREAVPFVATYHAGRLRGSSPALDVLAGLHRRTFESFMLEQSARLIAVSPFVRDEALADHRERVAIVPPGVDADRFVPDGEPSGHQILFVGPLSTTYAWKGLDVLWDAFQQVHGSLPDAELTIVGDGDRLAEYRARAAQADGSVNVRGRVSDGELVEAYQQARVVVLPSTSEAESFGMVLAEANACGRPVVGSRVGGIPAFVDHEANGLLAEPGDAEDLARRLERVLEDDALARRLGREGRKRVVDEHDWDRLAQRTEAVLAEAAATGG